MRFAFREIDLAGRQRLDDVNVAFLEIWRHMFRWRAVKRLRGQSAIPEGRVERRGFELSLSHAA